MSVPEAMFTLPAEAERRKRRSIERLRRERIPVVEHLPVIETAAEIKPRTTNEVVDRALALTIVAEMGATRDHDLAKRMTSAFDASKFLTLQERAFLENATPSDQEYVNFSWRYEGFGVLLWALGFLSTLTGPSQPFVAPDLARILIELGPHKFREKAALRSIDQVLDEADLMYRYHWAVTDARIAGKPFPGGLNPSVTYERHYALSWLIRYEDQTWDEISTDT